MLLASTGGHLAQLYQLRTRLIGDDEHFWVTFDTPQSRSLLAGHDVEFIPYVAPRDWATIVRNVSLARRILRARGVERIVSTGSGIALSFFPLARMRGVECRYVESAARSTGPSTTGRVLSYVPGVQTFTQYQGWASASWPKTASVFDDFVPLPDNADQPPPRKVVVTLGTIQGFGFRSLVERLLDVLPEDAEVLWQVGETPVADLPIHAYDTLPQADLVQAMREAEVVVAHSGIGSALSVLQLGRMPILVPRSAARGEHIDDHQVCIARELAGRDLVVHRSVDELTMEDLHRAARGRVGLQGGLRGETQGEGALA